MGLPSQPEGELARRDGAGRKPRSEATRRALSNTTVSAVVSPQTSAADPHHLRPQPRAEGGDSDPRAEGALSVDIVRASARIRIDFTALGAERASAARGALYDARRYVVTGANAVVRAMGRMDGDQLDEFMRREQRMPKTAKELPCPLLKSWGYTLIREIVPTLGSAVAVATSKMASTRYRQERWEAFVRQTRRPSHFNERLPIEIHLQGCSLRRTEEAGERRWWFDVSLTTGHNCRVSLPLMVKDAHQEQILSQCLAKAWKMGQPKIEQDHKRPGRWYVRLSYKRQVPRQPSGKRAAVHRGIRCCVVAVTEDGERWIYDGHDIEAYLKQMQRRRREYQNDSKASGRDGQGRKRILRPIGILEGRATNWRNTKNQTIARRLARWLFDRGVTSYDVEDLSGIRRGAPERVGESVWQRVQEWRFYDFGMRLQACLEELGITDRCEVAAHYLSQRCPSCGHTSPESVDLRRWQHRCDACGYRRHLDVAACENVLARATAKRQGDDRRYQELCGGEDVPDRPAKKKRAAKKPSSAPTPGGPADPPTKPTTPKGRAKR